MKQKFKTPQIRAPKIVQEERDSWKFWLKILGFMLLIVVVSVSSFDYGRERAGFDIQNAKEHRKTFKQEIESLDEQVEILTDQLATFQRSSQVDKQSVEIIKHELKKLTDENAALKEQIVFYKEVVAPEEQAKGVNIQSFQIQEEDQPGLYQYRIILTQFGKSKKGNQGIVTMKIHGISQGKPEILSLQQLTPKKIKHHTYKFKYFKRINGVVRVPESFRPTLVEINVDPKGSFPKSITEKYSWLVSGKQIF